MKINKLVMKNFSSYEGINEFDFKTNGKKNIVLIGGQNGAGKTSLFSAIKVALYGPIAFGYVGANSHYTSKIKDFINTKAFQTEKIESSVMIDISIKVEREYHDYEIERKWTFSKQKLEEESIVKKDGRIITEQEIEYFQNYLQGIIPPGLFEFFLFDGEEVGNIFSTNSYNTYVKNALFTMCDVDLFEVVRKTTSGYISKMGDNDVDDSEYRELEKQLESLSEEISSLELNKAETEELKNQVNLQLEELATAYKNAGGITIKEREKLNDDYNAAEKIKQETSIKIKSFVEGLMPFYIVKDFADKISNQLDLEEKGEMYFYIQNKIDKVKIKDSILKHQKVNNETVDEVISCLLETFCPKGYSDDMEPIHDLSKEEIGRVNAIFSMLESLDVDELLKLINIKNKASNKTAKINKLLKESMDENDALVFAKKENLLLKQRDELVNSHFYMEQMYLSKTDEYTILEQEKNRKYQSLIDSVQNKHVYALSTGISKIMEEVLSRKTVSLKRQLEEKIVENLYKIYRKNNLITHIEIEEDFQINLYQDISYKESELLVLINNIGKQEVIKLLGEKGTTELIKDYEIENIGELKSILENKASSKKINTYKKIELARLSKGERQIFILALYWAIVMISRQDIPFVIDTPYARIDANHRKEISKKFFPNISDQVIILSTDEEINEEYYRIIKPYISKEYLLKNDANANRTTVEKRYFFEVKE